MTNLRRFLPLVMCFAVILGLFQAVTFAASDNVWSPLTLDKVSAARGAYTLPLKYKLFELNPSALEAAIANAPLEFSGAARQTSVILEIPTPDGTIARFRVEESPIMENGLAVQFPTWKTYQAYNIDNPTETARLSWTTSGFRAMVLSPNGTYLVDPITLNDRTQYVVYNKSEYSDEHRGFHCDLDKLLNNEQVSVLDDSFSDAPQFSHGSQIRNYRLAVAATVEYTTVFRQVGDTDAQAKMRAMEQIVLIINRVDGVYRKDVAVSFTIIANNIDVVYAAEPDPYTNNNGSTMLGQNINNLNTVIGSANYDVGHVFSTGGGGIANLGVICGTSKGGGVTGLTNPVGDPFAIDYVAHEIGHQFGGSHTFNSTQGSCNGNRSTSSAFEPGSGITIMGYAGICGTGSNLALNSIDNFHIRSQTQIITHITTGSGSTCGTTSGTNTPPTVTTDASFNIPKGTPFELTATGADADGNALTYSWEEYDLGAASPPNNDLDGIARPILRPFRPQTENKRVFPSLTYILNNNNVPPATLGCGGSTCISGEVLPGIARTMNFRVSVRDGNGGTADTGTVVNVTNTASPFAITSQNTATNFNGNTTQTINWDVAATTAAPISTANVDILFSTDGGTTFPITLLSNTPNDGSQAITIPNVATANGRIKVKGAGNIFFDINNGNITVNPAVVSNKTPFDFDGDSKADISVFRSSNGGWYIQRSTAGFTGVIFGFGTDIPAPGDFDGDNKADISVFRPSNGGWYRLNSMDNTFVGVIFGQTGDIPVPADFDGDGKDDINVFRPSNGSWYRLNSTDGSFFGVAFGQNGDKPLVANFDGDNKADITVFRPSTGSFYSLDSLNGNFRGTAFGFGTDIPVLADYDGDNKTDVAVFRPSNGSWYRLNSTDGSFFGVAFGQNGDVPVPADYTGDGKADIGVFRDGNWYYLDSTSGSFVGVGFGFGTDKPLPSSFIP